MALRDLTQLQRLLLEIMPIAPGGESLEGLADDLLGRRGPVDRGRIRRALDALSTALGGIHLARGTDVLGRPDVPLYALRRRDLPRVRRFFANSARRKCLASPAAIRGSTRSALRVVMAGDQGGHTGA